jgi:O-antigen/teichoic acid export membrane protein
MSDSKSYTQIFKTTAFLGSVQVVSALINMIRAKIIALILGPVGFGFLNLYTSSIAIIINLFGFGLNFSAIRDFSLAKESHKIHNISKIKLIFNRWLLFSALLGTIAIILLSAFMSNWSFGNTEHVNSYIILSFYVFFITINNGFIAFFQGIRELRKMAKANIVGSLLGVIVSLPLYYYLGYGGIAWGLAASALCSFAVSFVINKSIFFPKVIVGWQESFLTGSNMAKLGVLMVISTLLGSITVFGVNTFIQRTGSISDVGLFQAGLGLSNQFVGLVLSAMASDYFPRLAGIHTDNRKVKELANQQLEISLLIATPLILGLIFLMPLAIRILYSKEFLVIDSFTRIIAVGMIWKVASFPMGYIPFAKGAKWVFFWLEGVYGNMLQLGLNCSAYYLWGLKGLGISFLLIYFIYFISIFLVTSKLYAFSLNRRSLKIVFISIIFSAIMLATTELISGLMLYLIGSTVCILSIIFSVVELDKQMRFINKIEEIINNH